jgi:hypothetical protein
LDINALHLDNLPIEYIDGEPRCYIKECSDNDKSLVVIGDELHQGVCIGFLYSAEKTGFSQNGISQGEE